MFAMPVKSCTTFDRHKRLVNNEMHINRSFVSITCRCLKKSITNMNKQERMHMRKVIVELPTSVFIWAHKLIHSTPLLAQTTTVITHYVTADFDLTSTRLFSHKKMKTTTKKMIEICLVYFNLGSKNESSSFQKHSMISSCWCLPKWQHVK